MGLEDGGDVSSGGAMIDVGIITGSGIYELPGPREMRVVESRFGEAEGMASGSPGEGVGGTGPRRF